MSKSSMDLYSAFDLYNAYGRKILSSEYRLKKSDVEQLLECIKRELLIAGRSSLIDVACLSCKNFFLTHRMPVYKFEPASFLISDLGRYEKIPAFDAWYIIIFLSGYLTSGEIAGDIERFLPYFFDGYKPKPTRPGELREALQKIDAEVRKCRGEMYDFCSSRSVDPEGSSLHESVPAVDKKRAEDYLATAKADIEKEKVAILDSARKQAEKERQEIIDAAYEEEKKIIQRASAEAEKKISISKKRIAEAIEENQNNFAMEAQLLQQGFSEVRSALFTANDMIKKLEDTVSESSIRKASNQLLELFNLIADTKDSTIDMARESDDQSLENAAYNMDVFLDMIIEYMAEYGIRPIASVQGDKYQPKYHAAGNGNQQFDPRSALIKASKRTGFLWGEQVLQKEQVEI